MENNYGFIGLGQMGHPMATNIVKIFKKLYVHDKTDTLGKTPSGATACYSITEISQKADTIFLSLPDGPVSISVVAEIASAANNQEKTIIDLSTIGPDAARKANALSLNSGIIYIDAPVSGGAIRAKNGSITIMWAGSIEKLNYHKKVLSTFSKNQFHVGNHPGQGQALKILNNFLSGTAMAATSEAMLYGLSEGLEMKTMLDVINVSTGQNTATRDKFPDRILTGTYDAGFKTGLLAKDVLLYLKKVREAGTPNQISEIISKIWSQCDKALPKSDITKIYEFLRDNKK